MAVPKKRISKQRKRKRRGNHKAAAAHTMACPKCGEPKLAHRVCPVCGTYRNEQVVEVEEI
ncbi:MAG: 50S ribosomal protein L32 [Longimicrobiales bacterium]